MSGSADQSYLDAFDKTGARLQGHFVLSSGLHSAGYLQCALVLSHPGHASMLAEALAQKVRGLGLKIDTVVSPAMGVWSSATRWAGPWGSGRSSPSGWRAS